MSKIEKHIEHYPNGEIKEKGTYKNGEKIGEWISYKEDSFIEEIKEL